MVSLKSLALLVALSGVGQVAGAGETVMLEFSADWCGPCQSMKPVIDRLVAEGFPVRQVDVDRNRSLAAKYRVTGIPCFVLVVDGQEVHRAEGIIDRDQLVEMMHKAGVTRPSQSPARARAQSPDDSPAAAVPNGHGHAASDAIGSNEDGDLLLRSSVRIKVDDSSGHSYGSGTIIDARDGEALVLTCGHLFRDSDGKGRISVDLVGPHAPKQIEGMLISYDLKRDLGLVSIRPGVPVTVTKVAPKGRRIALGDRVTNIGCNNGQEPTVRRTRVTGVDKYLGPSNVEVAGMPVEGRSGGGLFDQQGQLIGVCFAADPEDNEGVYAGLASVHAELDRLGLADIYGPPEPTRPTTELASSGPPPMPGEMPTETAEISAAGHSPGATLRRLAEVRHDSPARAADDVLSRLAPKERAALGVIQSRSQDAEVICIIRSLSDPDAKSEIIVLDRASPLFLEQLSRSARVDHPKHLTSLAVPNTLPAARAADRRQEGLDAAGWRSK